MVRENSEGEYSGMGAACIKGIPSKPRRMCRS